MIKRKISGSDLLLILANLIPVFGVWFLGWSPTEAFIVYAMETMIVGILTILKMLIATIAKAKMNGMPWENNPEKRFLLYFLLYYTFWNICHGPNNHLFPGRTNYTTKQWYDAFLL
jgi:hypothetical protein